MGADKHKKNMEYYLANRTPVNFRCIKAGTDPKKDDIHLCSKLIMTDDPECFCEAFVNPDAKWLNSDCPLADEVLKTVVEEKETGKKRVGQQKQKKKARR